MEHINLIFLRSSLNNENNHYLDIEMEHFINYLINNGFITPFLERKWKSKRDKNKYLIEQTWEDNKKTFVAYEKIDKESVHGDTTYHLKTSGKFVSYLDWLHDRKKTQEILSINSRQAPNYPEEKVFFNGLELLKMGGIELPVNGFNILLRGKRMEFVNLCGLKLNGKIYYGEEGNWSCYYCACDNWKADNFEIPCLKLFHCSCENFNVKSSKLSHWHFFNCNVKGDFVDSKLYTTFITGGSFKPVLIGCILNYANIEEDKSVPNNNFEGYRSFKKIYQNQGDDDIAKKYYVKEKEYIRDRSKGWGWFTKTISHFYWEYGCKPHRVIYYSIATVLIFALLFYFNLSLIDDINLSSEFSNIGNSLYFSAITYTTLGYGDLSPIGWLKVVCSIEALLGLINMGFLIAGYTNTKY